MCKLIFQKWILRSDLKKNPDKIYLFGDNDERYGYGGQAFEMRGENNTIGIRVKKTPMMEPESFYIDTEYGQNCKKIDQDFIKISKERDVVIPLDGIGTGLAKLPKKAPRTFEYLQHKIRELAQERTVEQ